MFYETDNSVRKSSCIHIEYEEYFANIVNPKILLIPRNPCMDLHVTHFPFQFPMKQVLEFEDEIVASSRYAELTKMSSQHCCIVSWCPDDPHIDHGVVNITEISSQITTQASVVIIGMAMVTFDCFICGRTHMTAWLALDVHRWRQLAGGSWPTVPWVPVSGLPWRGGAHMGLMPRPATPRHSIASNGSDGHIGTNFGGLAGRRRSLV